MTTCVTLNLYPLRPLKQTKNYRGKQSEGTFFMKTILLSIITILGRQALQVVSFLDFHVDLVLG